MKKKNNIYQIPALAGFLLAFVGCISMALWKPGPVFNGVLAPEPSSPDLQTNVDLQRTCAEMFREIIAVQNSREQKRIVFEQVQLAFNEGVVLDTDFSVASNSWLADENSLATHAASLYERGRVLGCFQKVTQ